MRRSQSAMRWRCVSCGRQSRRRRVHDRRIRRRPQDFRRLPRKSAAEGYAGHVPRPRRADCQRAFDQAGIWRWRSPERSADWNISREKYGTLPRADLINPAISLAETGFTLDQGDVIPLAVASEALRQYPAAAAIFLKDGKTPKVGDRLVQERSRPYADGDPRPAARPASTRARSAQRWSSAIQKGGGHHHRGGFAAHRTARTGADHVRLSRLYDRLRSAAELGRRDARARCSTSSKAIR